MRYSAALLLALSTVACGEGETVLPSPTVLITTANTVCGTQITSFSVDVDYSGPTAVIDVAFASNPEPLQIEIERYLSNGQTELVAALENVAGRVLVDLSFNTRYRARARAGSCTWSAWVDYPVGPPNPCGDCAGVPPPPPPDCESEENQGLSFLGRTLWKGAVVEEPKECTGQ